MADEIIKIDVREGLAGVANLKDGLADARQEAVKLNAATKNLVANEAVLKAVNNVRDLNVEFNKLATATANKGKAGKAAADKEIVSVIALNQQYRTLAKEIRAAADAGKEITKEQQAGLSKYTEGLKGSISALEGQSTATAGVSKATGVFNNLVKFSPLGILIGIITAVVAKLSTFQVVVDKVSQVMAAANAITTVLADRILSLGSSILNAGKALGNFLSGNFGDAMINASDAVDNFKETFTGLGGAISDAATRAIDLEKRVQNLRDAQLSAAVGIAAQTAASEKLQRAAEDETKTYDERTRALQGAISIERGLVGQRIAFARQNAALAKEQYALSAKNVSDRETLVAAEIAVIQVQSEAEQKRIDLISKLNAIEKQRTEFIKKNLDEVAATISKLNAIVQQDPVDAAIEETRNKYQKLTEEAKKALQDLRDIEAQQTLTPEQLADRQKLSGLIIDLSEKESMAEIDAAQAALKKLSEVEEAKKRAQEKIAKDKADAIKKAQEASVKELEALRDLGTKQIDIEEEIGKGLIIALEKSGASEAKVKEAKRVLDLTTQRARLQNELSFQQALLEITDQGDTIAIKSIEASIDKIRAAIKNVDLDLPPGKKSFLEQLGLTKKDLDQISQAGQAVVGFLKKITDARVEDADKALEIAKKKTDAAQAEFDKQKELDASGFADSLDTATLRLAAAKDEEDKALKIKQDAQRKQVQLDSAIQLSSLLTSSANIFKSLSGLGPIGVAAAVVTIAAMFAAFAAARSRAAQATKFRQGGEVGPDGVVRGPSHEGGGVGFEMEGGEFVHTDGRRLAIVNKRSTSGEFDLLAAINKNDEGAKTRWALNRVATMNRDGIDSAIGEGRGSVTVINKEDRKAHGLLKQIRDKKNQTSETWIENGYRVTKKGNRTEKVRI